MKIKLKSIYQYITDGKKTRTYAGLKSPSQSIEEILISDKYNENEVNNEKGESDNEGDRF